MDPQVAFARACELASSGEHEKALGIFQDLGQAGHVSSQLRVADCYVKGLGTDVNLDMAIVWLTATRKRGSGEAETLLELVEAFQRIEEFQRHWSTEG